MPKLTLAGAMPEVDLFRPVVMEPGLDPFSELAKALLTRRALGEELAGGQFEDRNELAKARRAAAHSDRPRPARLLLAADQAERLFTEASKDAEAFGALLQALAGRAAYFSRTMILPSF